MAPGRPLGDVGRLLVRATWHVQQFQAQESFLNFVYLFTVLLHLLVLWLVRFVGEVDEELGVTSDGEAPHSQHRRSLEAGDQALILSDVIGDLPSMLKA